MDQLGTLDNSYVVSMKYIGGVLSKNRYQFHGTHHIRPEVRRWMDDLAKKVADLGVPLSHSYDIEVSGEFRDGRAPDLHNIFIVVADAIEKGLGINDKYFNLSCGTTLCGVMEPKVVIKIQPKGVF